MRARKSAVTRRGRAASQDMCQGYRDVVSERNVTVSVTSSAGLSRVIYCGQFPTKNALFPQRKICNSHLIYPGSRLIFNSTEERSSRRRERQGAVERPGNGTREAAGQPEVTHTKEP